MFLVILSLLLPQVSRAELVLEDNSDVVVCKPLYHSPKKTSLDEEIATVSDELEDLVAQREIERENEKAVLEVENSIYQEGEEDASTGDGL